MKLSDFLTDVGRPIAYYPGLRKITGSTTATIFLCQFVYWTGKESSGDGWIYKTSDEIESETGLSYHEQKTAREKLKSNNLISEKYARLDHQMYFKVNLETLNNLWGNPPTVIPESDNVALGNDALPHSLIGTTETTTENTSIEESFSSKKRTSKKGDLIDGMLSYSKDKDKTDAIEKVLARLDKTFGLNLPRNPDWQSLAKFILEQTNPTLDQWITWYISDDFRMTSSIHITTDKIRMWWPKAHRVERPIQKPVEKEDETKYVNLTEWRKEHGK
jgi:hypothetical protein